MTIMSKQRAEEIAQGLAQLKSGWPFVVAEVDERLKGLVEKLISKECEETRGRIKELVYLKELTERLQSELEVIGAALSEEDAA